MLRKRWRSDFTEISTFRFALDHLRDRIHAPARRVATCGHCMSRSGVQCLPTRRGPNHFDPQQAMRIDVSQLFDRASDFARVVEIILDGFGHVMPDRPVQLTDHHMREIDGGSAARRPLQQRAP